MKTLLYTHSRQRSGFALVATVSMMVLLSMIALAMLSLATIEQRSSSQSNDALRTARGNARMALMMAIGELQKAAGPDQRITATASILGHSSNGYTKDTTAVDGRKHWMGVWKTSDYSPATPDSKTFVRWLVSSGDPSAVEGDDALDLVGNAPSDATDVVIFEGLNAAGTVKVPKVEVSTDSGNKSYYAYWVEDEGVKADLAWNEIPAASASAVDEERAQARRLSSAPAPNYWLSNAGGAGLLGPFRDANDDGSTSDAISGVFAPKANFSTGDMDKVSSMENLPLMAGGNAAHRKWLKGIRHQRSMHNRGVLADVKQGGLRRDLSLAFEMDGDADVSASEQPTLFNQQYYEFVAGADRLAAPSTAKGMPVAERFLYRDYRGSGTTFSNDIQNVSYKGHPTVVRGPNWWAVRDYYNLYKRLKGSSGNYTLGARAYYPNRSVGDGNYHYGSMHGVHNARTWDVEKYNDRWGNPRYIFKPARASYAPVLLGQKAIFSVLAINSNGTEADLALGIDPFFYLWNPYNRRLQVDSYAMMLTSFPGHITFEVEKQDGTKTRYGPATISMWLQREGLGQGHFTNLSYMASNLTMEPGEVVVLSPRSSRNASRANAFHDELFPGTNTDNESGAILTKIPNEDGGGWNAVKLNLANDTVRFLYSTQYFGRNGPGNTAMAEHIWTNASMPRAGMKPIDVWRGSNPGEHLQQLGGNVAGDRWSIPLHFRPNHRAGGSLPPYTGTSAANTMVNIKRFFGVSSNLLMPAAHEGVYANPMEVFTQMNPFRMAGYSDLWRPCLPNETYTGVADPGDVDALLLECGAQFPASFPENGFYGRSYGDSGRTLVPIANIPSSPMLSLAALSHANFGVGYGDPYFAVGNSWADVFVSPSSPYGPRPAPSYMGSATAADVRWLLNDALFDRYFFSGIVPEYTIGSGGYNATGSLKETLDDFYGVTGTGYKDAQASPVLEPYLPSGKTGTEIVSELLETDHTAPQWNSTDNDTPGYKKMAAYSMLKGGFNINCTDAGAWGAFLRGVNSELDIKFSDGTTDSRSGYTGFPSSSSPAPPISGEAASQNQTWGGWSRLKLRGQINSLATNIANEVKARGPFMSLSDFVNHRVGNPQNTASRYMGAIQAAITPIGAKSLVDGVHTSAGGLTPGYTSTDYFAADTASVTNRKSTAGIPGDVTQANVLLSLAPRLTARSDTFRVRGYGEVRDASDNIIATATCEALVQRLPEYVDSETNPDFNEPWDEYDPNQADPTINLNETNQLYGRRFKIRSFRWLDASEI